jgi:hypothetical protein
METPGANCGPSPPQYGIFFSTADFGPSVELVEAGDVWVVGDLNDFDFRAVLDLGMEVFERRSICNDRVIAQRNPPASIIRQSVVQLSLGRDLLGYGHVAPFDCRNLRRS